MRRINLLVSDIQFEKIASCAKTLDIKPGTFCKLASFSAASIQIMPDVDLSAMIRQNKRVKQLNLFHTKE